MFFFSLYSRVFVGLVRCYFILSLDFGCFARFLEHLFGFFIYIFSGGGGESRTIAHVFCFRKLSFSQFLCVFQPFFCHVHSLSSYVCVCVCPKPHFRAMASDTGLGANSLKTVMCTINKFKPFGHSLCVRCAC